MIARKDLTLLIALAGTLLWAGGIVAAPVVDAVSGPVSALVYALGAVVCHQLPDRSFHLAGVQLPVCARCTGLYVGAAVGLLGWALGARTRPHPWPRGWALLALAVASLPTATTVATAWVGLGDPANIWRATLALPLGLVGGAMVGAMASEHLK